MPHNNYTQKSLGIPSTNIFNKTFREDRKAINDNIEIMRCIMYIAISSAIHLVKIATPERKTVTSS